MVVFVRVSKTGHVLEIREVSDNYRITRFKWEKD